MDAANVALVTGVTGVIGRSLALYLSRLENWNVIGLSRRKPDMTDGRGRFQHISIDLLNASECKDKLRGLKGINHILHAAYVDRPTMAERVAPNMAILGNVVDNIEPFSRTLRHIHILQGTKYYGNHLGPFKTPAKETDPRHMPPNFYYDQEDFIRDRQLGKPWTWSASRPHGVCGFAVGNPMNLTMVIAVFAAISKELGLPLCFPGTPGNYRAIYQCTDAAHLAKAIAWMSTEPKCANEAFNVTNGDFIRWENLWPKMAAYFGMELGTQRHIQLSEMMADKKPVWNRIVDKYRLKPYRYEEIVSWGFGDFVFTPEFDIMSDMTKARQHGFCDVVDTEEMFYRLFGQFQEDRIIP
jgi:nucleoside-diphosphate-sugar epimerase